MKKYYLYKHTFPNGKVYIGITCQKPERRWRFGKGYLIKNKITGEYNQPAIANAIIKYGWENIQRDILLETNDKNQIQVEERKYIVEIYHSNDPEFGYNITNGGNYCGLFSKETRKIMSDRKKGKIPWNKGKTFSQEARKHMSLAHIGKKPSEAAIEKRKKTLSGFKHSEEAKKKMSIKALGNKNALGIKHTKEWIEKLRSRKLGQLHSKETKDKIRLTKKAQKWWNNGKVETMCVTCPDESFIRGRLKNGTTSN